MKTRGNLPLGGRLIITVSFLLFFLCASVLVSRAEKETDSVEIVSVTPNHYDNYTDEVTFTATIHYSLQTKEQGIVYLGFNTSDPHHYEVDTSEGAKQVVSRGEGTVVLSETVVPVNWSGGARAAQQGLDMLQNGALELVTDFKIYANVSEYPHDIPWTPLAVFESKITALPEQAEPSESGEGSAERVASEEDVFGNLIGQASSTKYDPALAHYLINLCNAVHDKADMRAAFAEMGITDDEQELHYDMKDVYLAYGIGRKTLADGSSLLVVVCRGSDDLIEWLGNVFDASTNQYGEHSSFSDAGRGLLEQVKIFAEKRDISFEQAKFVITGHSRGAAAANIMAAVMADEGIAEENVYCYTFACPDVAVISAERAGSYRNIFNIGNVNDPVTWVPSALWTDSEEDRYWDKYGSSYWFCEDWGDYPNISKKYVDFLDVCKRVASVHPQDKYLAFLEAEKPLKEYKDRAAATEAIDNAAKQRTRDRQEWIEKSGKKPQEDFGVETTVLDIFCPVDVSVTDGEGRVLASVQGDSVEKGEEILPIVLLVGEEKRIIFEDADELSVDLAGTAEGSMDFAVYRGGDFADALENGKEFSRVPIEDGKRMRCDISEGAETQDVALFAVGSDGEDVAEILTDGSEEELDEGIVGGDSIGKSGVDGEGKGFGEMDEESGEDAVEGDESALRGNYVVLGVAGAVLLFGAIFGGLYWKRGRR